MSLKVFLAIILAAFLHAIWNAMVKKEDDKYTALTAIVLGHVPIALFILLLFPMPTIESIPYIFVSAIFLTCYELCLMSAYRLEDYTKVYPIARGIAPIFVVIFSLFLFNSNILKFELMGIFTISLGIVILVFQNVKNLKNYSGLFYAIGTGFFISCYTITDGYGGRISSSPMSYTAWLLILNAFIFIVLLSILKKQQIIKKVFKQGKNILFVGGTLSFTVYCTIVWAFTHAPVPLVAALRETSIIWALLIGASFLKEKLTKLKITSIVIIFSGVALIKLF